MKNFRKIGLFCLVLLACIFFFSCTFGEYIGISGGDKLIITKLGNFKGNFINVSGTFNLKTYSFNKNVKITGDDVGASLYNGNDKYADSDTFPKITITMYDKNGIPLGSPTPKDFFNVKFINGGAVVDW